MIFFGLLLLALGNLSSAQRLPPCYRGLPYTYSPPLGGETTQQPDAAACQARCAGVVGCVYFSFAEDTRNCSLHAQNAILVANASAAASSAWTSGDTHCCIGPTGCNSVGSLTCGNEALVTFGGSGSGSRLDAILRTKLSAIAWVKATSVVEGMGIVGAVTDERDDIAYPQLKGWGLYIGKFGRIRFALTARQPQHFLSIYSKTSIIVDQWYHVAATYEGDLARSPGMRLYVDGKLEQESIADQQSGAVKYATEVSSLKMLGVHNFAASTWHGKVANLALYNNALDADVISAFARNPLKLPSVSDPNLAAGFLYQAGPSLLDDITGTYSGRARLFGDNSTSTEDPASIEVSQVPEDLCVFSEDYPTPTLDPRPAEDRVFNETAGLACEAHRDLLPSHVQPLLQSAVVVYSLLDLFLALNDPYVHCIALANDIIVNRQGMEELFASPELIRIQQTTNNEMPYFFISTAKVLVPLVLTDAQRDGTESLVMLDGTNLRFLVPQANSRTLIRAEDNLEVHIEYLHVNGLWNINRANTPAILKNPFVTWFLYATGTRAYSAHHSVFSAICKDANPNIDKLASGFAQFDHRSRVEKLDFDQHMQVHHFTHSSWHVNAGQQKVTFNLSDVEIACCDNAALDRAASSTSLKASCTGVFEEKTGTILVPRQATTPSFSPPRSPPPEGPGSGIFSPPPSPPLEGRGSDVFSPPPSPPPEGPGSSGSGHIWAGVGVAVGLGSMMLVGGFLFRRRANLQAVLPLACCFTCSDDSESTLSSRGASRGSEEATCSTISDHDRVHDRPSSVSGLTTSSGNERNLIFDQVTRVEQELARSADSCIIQLKSPRFSDISKFLIDSSDKEDVFITYDPSPSTDHLLESSPNLAIEYFERYGYSIIREIGRGSFATVYLAECHATKSYVTVKVYFDPQNKQAIVESCLLGLLRDNPLVVKMHKTFLEDNRLFILMEYCSRGDLSDFIKSQSGPLPMTLVSRWLVELLVGVGYMHQISIAHRDIKPDNIFLASNLSLRLGDLGLCRLMVNPSSTYAGSPMYMSPEQHQHKPYGLASDIWALGCTIYQMCMKQPPYMAETMPEFYTKLAATTIKPIPSDIYGDAIPRIVSMMLASNPTLRPSAATLLADPWIKGQRAELLTMAHSSQEGGTSHVTLRKSTSRLNTAVAQQSSSSEGVESSSGQISCSI